MVFLLGLLGYFDGSAEGHTQQIPGSGRSLKAEEAVPSSGR